MVSRVPLAGRHGRREFLRLVAAGAVGSASPIPLALGGPSGSERTGWFDRPMRWAQLTLVENDPGRFDPDFWLDYFRRTRSDAACLSAGGCVAYYPTGIPLHHRSAWLGDSDPFGYLVEGCRRLGMVVLARTDSHAIHEDAREAHPEWVAVDGEGRPRRHWASPEMWVTCVLGNYSFDFMTGVHQEIMQRYRVDGIFTNRWAGSGMCYCESCRRMFAAYCRMELPRTEDPSDPSRRNHILWEQERLFELWRLWDSEIRKLNPEARYIANAGGGALSGLDMVKIGEIADILFADRQGRRGVMVPWANGKNGKEYRATLGMKPIGGIFSVGLEEPYRWKDSVQSEAEIRVWVADGIANGLRPWFTKFSGTLYDRRWLEVVEKIYLRHAGMERYLRNLRPVANVGMVYSQQTAQFYGGSKAWEKVEAHTLGFYHALIESRIPFEMVHDRLLDADHLSPFRLLVLPNIAALSSAQCDQLRTFVRNGGSLVATFETSLYDEWGSRRPDFGLADLFGARVTGGMQGPMQNSYLEIVPDARLGGFHPLVKGLEDAGRIINGVRRVEAGWLGDPGSSPLRLIPGYPDLPMEKVYPREGYPDTPGVFVRSFGKGTVIYFPWDIDRSYWEFLAADHGVLLSNSVKWSIGEDVPVKVTGSGVLDVTVWEQEQSMTVHLVNLTNPMMMKGPVRELIPVGPLTVALRIPPGRNPASLCLGTGEAVSFRFARPWLEAVVPSVLDHEVLAVEWAD